MQPHQQINTPAETTPYLMSRAIVAQGINSGLSSTLLAIDTPEQVNPGSREYHQAEAIRAASDVAFQFTAQAKKQAKRKCLGHLIASLSCKRSISNEADSE